MPEDNYIINKISKKDKIFSGIQPSGEIHIGNYLGAIKSWIDLQETNEAIYCVVDYHALTENPDPKKLKKQTFDAIVDLLAAGVDPKKSTLFVQSSRPEHTELCWLLNTITPVGDLQRVPTFKDKSETNKTTNMGLMDYPVLMAADIMIYDATAVPVGEDQLPHIELTRQLANSFNSRFGKTLTEPKAFLYHPGQKIMSLLDPTKKMSKSLGAQHYIALRDEPEVIREKLKRAVTDSAPGKEMSAGVKNLFGLLEEFSKDTDINAKFYAEYTKGTIKYSELKDHLATVIAEHFAPFRAKVKELESNREKVEKIISAGAKKLETSAQEKLLKIKNLMGLQY